MIDRRFTAINTARDSENRMHDDEVARRYGFERGLVPGVDVFGYMCDAFEEQYGTEWRSNGWGELRLIRPFYEGEIAIVRGNESDVAACGEDGGVRATLRIGVAKGSGLTIARLPLNDPRPVASAESLAPGTVMGSYQWDLREASPRELLEAANLIFMANYVLEPWIHTASRLQWLAAPRAGQTIEVRAAIEELFVRKGQPLVRFTVVYSTDGIPLLRVDHTAIWRYSQATS